MHTFRRARIPIAFLPPPLNTVASPDAELLEPWRECDVSVAGKHIVSVHASEDWLGADGSSADVTDLGGRLVFPGLLEVHTHLDKCHTWDRSPGRHSDFWESLGILGADSARWDEEDVYRRADFALRTTWPTGQTPCAPTSTRAGASARAAMRPWTGYAPSGRAASSSRR